VGLHTVTSQKRGEEVSKAAATKVHGSQVANRHIRAHKTLIGRARFALGSIVMGQVPPRSLARLKDGIRRASVTTASQSCGL